MGFKNLANGQILRGILFLFAEAVFIFYMITTGGYWLSMLPSLGKLGPTKEYNLVLDVYTTTYHDNSFKILLYGVLTVFFINIWIGIPYLMLITTGILMNIPADLYESARIDGASGWQQYSKITLPYMLFVTGPYLLTSFTGNMNNFNVIYLLTGGAPTNNTAIVSGTVGYTDLLITWLFKITTGAESQYYMASIIGILVFLVVAIISLIVYNLLPSIKNEEDFQ